MKGLKNHMSFNNLTKADKELTLILAAIEREDANRCANCGGEDCVCCDYYADRQKWMEPEELFADSYIDDVPDIDSDDFLTYCDNWDLIPDEDSYKDFVDDWYRDARNDYMY